MDRLTRLLAGLLGRAAGLLPGRRRDDIRIPVALRAEYKHEISVGQAGQTGSLFLLFAPIIGIFLGGVAAAVASAGLPRPAPSGNDGTRATAPGDA